MELGKEISLVYPVWILALDNKEEKEEKGKTFHRVERRHGEFRRVIQLPDAVQSDKVEASFDNGILTVDIPKGDAVKPTRIPVKS